MPINQHGLSPPGAVFYGVGIRDLNLTVDWGNRFLACDHVLLASRAVVWHRTTADQSFLDGWRRRDRRFCGRPTPSATTDKI